MKTGIWVGGLVLSLAGCASELLGQEAQWKSPTAPAPIALGELELTPCPKVTLGRPVPLKPAAKRSVAPLSIVPASYQAPSVEAGAVNPLMTPVPMLPETLPNWPEDEEPAAQPQSSGFAEDRQPRQPNTPTLGSLVSLGAPVNTPVASVAYQTPTPSVLATAPLPEPLPEAVAPINHDLWGPGLDGDPMRPSFYVSAEYLFWWSKADHVPALVTTANPNNVNPNGRFGFVGQSSTQTLFGDSDINGEGRSGFRVTAGLWLDMFHEEGLEISGFALGRQSNHFTANSADNPVLARPFFNQNTNTEFSELVAFPGISTGRVSVDTASQFWGIEGDMRYNLLCCCDRRIDFLVGFRYLDLGESLGISEDIQGLAGAPAPFTNQRGTVFDSFTTRNSFYGAQVGLDSEYRYGRWFLDLRGKLAVGVTHETVTINGGQTLTSPTGTMTSTGGLLALSTNIGSTSKNRFSFAPEVGANLGYQITDNIRLFGGYNFLYWSNVVRPGDQIDRTLDVTKIPNFPVGTVPAVSQSHPLAPFKQTDFFAHGINIGLEFRY